MMNENIALYAFRKYGDTALQAAYCCLGNRADAEKAAQAVFFALHRNPRTFSDDAQLKAYILRAVIQRCNTLHRRLRRRIRLSVESVLAGQSETQIKHDN